MPSRDTRSDGLAEFNAKINVMALVMRKAVFGMNAQLYRNDILVLPHEHEHSIHYAEEALELYRDDALKFPALAKLLSVFK